MFDKFLSNQYDEHHIYSNFEGRWSSKWFNKVPLVHGKLIHLKHLHIFDNRIYFNELMTFTFFFLLYLNKEKAFTKISVFSS